MEMIDVIRKNQNAVQKAIQNRIYDRQMETFERAVSYSTTQVSVVESGTLKFKNNRKNNSLSFHQPITQMCCTMANNSLKHASVSSNYFCITFKDTILMVHYLHMLRQKIKFIKQQR